jgi:hypothetical protein
MTVVRALVLFTVLMLTSACAAVAPADVRAGAPPAPPAASAPAGPADPVRSTATGTVKVEVTFYGGLDNDPPSSNDIAYPNSRHATAGGTGTYQDPITLATDVGELPPGTVAYLPMLQKYFVMEDDCAECDSDWSAGHHPHVDLWMAPAGAGLIACEEQLTPDAPVALEVNPPADRPVDPRPLYTAAGGCWRPMT